MRLVRRQPRTLGCQSHLAAAVAAAVVAAAAVAAAVVEVRFRRRHLPLSLQRPLS
jgi:hypothetical protein